MSEKTEKVGQIYSLIPKIMQDVGAIGKSRKNTQQGYAFRGIDDLYNALQAPLCKHGVFFVPEVLERSVTERPTKDKQGLLFYTVMKVRFTFYAPDASSIQTTTIGEAMDSGDKSSNKAQSAALKYALLELFCIPTEEQDDADYQTHEVGDPLADNDYWQAMIDEAFQARDFDAPQADAAISDLLKKHRCATLANVPIVKRASVLEIIKSGKADKYKANGKPAETALA